MNNLMSVETNSNAWIVPTHDPNFITLRISARIAISFLEDIGFLIHEGVFMPPPQNQKSCEGGKLSILPTDIEGVVELISEVTVPAGQIAHFSQYSSPRSTLH